MTILWGFGIISEQCLNMRVSNGFAIWYIMPVEGFFIEEVALKCQVLGCVQCIFDDVTQCTARQPNITCSVVLHYLEHNIHRACIYIYTHIDDHFPLFTTFESFRTKPRWSSARQVDSSASSGWGGSTSRRSIFPDIAGFGRLNHVEACWTTIYPLKKVV